MNDKTISKVEKTDGLNQAVKKNEEPVITDDGPSSGKELSDPDKSTIRFPHPHLLDWTAKDEHRFRKIIVLLNILILLIIVHYMARPGLIYGRWVLDDTSQSGSNFNFEFKNRGLFHIRGIKAEIEITGFQNGEYLVIFKGVVGQASGADGVRGMLIRTSDDADYLQLYVRSDIDVKDDTECSFIITIHWGCNEQTFIGIC